MTTAFVPPNFEDLTAAQVSLPSPVSPGIGIIGDSAEASALFCYINGRGLSIGILREDACLHGRITVRGGINGRYNLAETGQPLKALLETCKTIIVVEPPGRYAEVAWSMAPWLKPGHMIVLYDGGFGASLEFAKLIRASGVFGVPVVEMDATFSFASAKDQCLRVGAVKQLIHYSCPTQSETFNTTARLSRLFPKSEPARNVFQRGICDLISLIHPLAFITNMNAIDRGQSPTLYAGAFSEKSISLVEQIESEACQIALEFDTAAMPFSILLKRSYGCDATTLYTALQTARCFDEDESFDRLRAFSRVESSFVPLYELARLANLRTPVIDSVINMASVTSGRDFLSTGRTLARLGFSGMGRREIANNING